MDLPLDRYGMPWRVSIALTADASLVKVGDAIREQVAGQESIRCDQIIILGFAWSFVADAAGEGFNLVAVDYTASPLGVSGENLVIFGDLSQAAARCAGSVTPCHIPLSAGVYSPLRNSAELQVDVIGTPTSGRLVIWGITVPAEEAVIPIVQRIRRGSPAVFP